MNLYVGLDVSLAKLDVCCLTDDEQFSVLLEMMFVCFLRELHGSQSASR